ncbi:hypothetical protein BdWA1_001293 [Babesia duncani]|uniref:Uncharacterized protein n=1 Tax=Babesia duncani TaxID=323732 RepID=A0AAD9PNT1_9APIC|nr:hypothetical protein BdWA1_001293 [Babesia duncani]
MEFISLALFLGACLTGTDCVSEKANLNPIVPALINGTVNYALGNNNTASDPPKISLKIMPSKRLRLTPTEMNMLLFGIKQEITRKVKRLEGKVVYVFTHIVEQLIEHKHENEQHLSAWVLNQAPIYMPFRNSKGQKMPAKLSTAAKNDQATSLANITSHATESSNNQSDQKLEHANNHKDVKSSTNTHETTNVQSAPIEAL